MHSGSRPVQNPVIPRQVGVHPEYTADHETGFTPNGSSGMLRDCSVIVQPETGNF